MRTYYVYIMTSRTGTLYTGVTDNLERRVREHKSHQVPGFTARYRIDRLVYFEETPNVTDALRREKEIKGWRRSKKLALIKAINPKWEDLSDGWFDEAHGTSVGADAHR